LFKKIIIEDKLFFVAKHVYEPAEDSILFVENLIIRAGALVLDVGTGCGVIGITAAEKAAKVVATDINPYAVRCAKKNAQLNYLANKMFFLHGDLFSPIQTKIKFDYILFNPPYLPVEIEEHSSWLGRAWSGGATGRQIIDRFIRESPQYLARDGQIFLMQSTLSKPETTIKVFREQGLTVNVIARRSLPFFEAIVLFKATHQGVRD
jgi:release factor glutamine methyltransferase